MRLRAGDNTVERAAGGTRTATGRMVCVMCTAQIGVLEHRMIQTIFRVVKHQLLLPVVRGGIPPASPFGAAAAPAPAARRLPRLRLRCAAPASATPEPARRRRRRVRRAPCGAGVRRRACACGGRLRFWCAGRASLLGGYSVGDTVYYIGKEFTTSDGDTTRPGRVGRAAGRGGHSGQASACAFREPLPRDWLPSH